MDVTADSSSYGLEEKSTTLTTTELATMVRVLQSRLHVPQASQLAQQSPAAGATAGTVAVNDRFLGALSLRSAAGAGAAILNPSQFWTGGTSRKVLSSSKNSEPCPSSSGRAPLGGGGGGGGGGMKVLCMATERRVKMVSQQIKREISEMLLYDKVVQAAVLPETALGADMYLTAVATISDVEMSKDLSVAKVFISIYGDERGQDKALEALKNKAGYVRKVLANRMNLKNTPEVRFIKDESLERGSRVIGILDKLKKERQLKEGTGPVDGEEEEEGGDKQDDHEDDGEEVEQEKPIRSFSRSKGDEDESDWEEGENITFIR
ncbi:unnamed protein product [Calypogeia fissa]